ncbi:hypothetical protein HMI55_004295 [Coelomomyces lativittatus]|nr:hypothetical protein HMI55_004295 [Coelomomyces lativittatus]
MNLTLNKQKKKRYIKEMNWKSAWIELKSLRSIGIQGDWDPFQIFKLASMVLNKWKIHGGGDEIWTVLERYIISCLRLGCFQEAWVGMQLAKIYCLFFEPPFSSSGNKSIVFQWH